MNWLALAVVALPFALGLVVFCALVWELSRPEDEVLFVPEEWDTYRPPFDWERQ